MWTSKAVRYGCWCAVVLLIYSAALAQAPGAQVTTESKPGGAATRLNELIALSKATTVKAATGFSDWSDLLSRSLELAKQASAYCSVTLLKDVRDGRLKDRDYVVTRWRVDFVRPNRYHITQQAWDMQQGDLLDHWVSIGKENYQDAGLWMRTEDMRNEKVNRRLSLESMLNVLDILRSMKPMNIGVHGHLNERYLLLEYDKPASREGFVNLCELLSDGNCHLQVWINLNTGLLAKAQVIVEGTSTKGDPVDIEVHQAFTCYNENVRVEPPPWLNIVLDAKGKATIVNTKKPVVRQYE